MSISGLPGTGSGAGGSDGKDDDEATASAWDALILARKILMTSRSVPLGRKLTVPESLFSHEHAQSPSWIFLRTPVTHGWESWGLLSNNTYTRHSSCAHSSSP